jgi:hypothetical protein
MTTPQPDPPQLSPVSPPAQPPGPSPVPLPDPPRPEPVLPGSVTYDPADAAANRHQAPGPLAVTPSDQMPRPEGLAFDVEPGADLTGVPTGDQTPKNAGAGQIEERVRERGESIGLAIPAHRPDPAGATSPEEELPPPPRPEPGDAQLADDPGYLTETGQAVAEDGSVAPIIGGLPAVQGSAWDIGAPLDERGAGLADKLGDSPSQPGHEDTGSS